VLSRGAPVHITVWSYVDQLGIAVLTDDETFHDPRDATDALNSAFTELQSAAGLSASPQTFVLVEPEELDSS
jgi:diacylglycerol O-acyltransferase / wax synthase